MCVGNALCVLEPQPCVPLTMAMLESWTAGRPGGTSEMLRKAETETEVPEGLMMQRGGADACSTSRRGASTAGLWGWQVSGDIELHRAVPCPEATLSLPLGAPHTCMKMVPKKVALSKTSRSLGTCREDESEAPEGEWVVAVDPSRAALWTQLLALQEEPSPPSCPQTPACPGTAHLLALELYGQHTCLEVGMHG